MNEKFLTEKISYYRLWLTFLYPTDASLLVWFSNNYGKIEAVKFSVVIILLIVITISIFSFNHKMRKFIKKMEE